MREFIRMDCLLAAALLLAGCAPAPKPNEYSAAQLDEVFRAMDEDRKAHIKAVDDIVVEAIKRRNKLVAENEALKVHVADLEKRCPQPAAHGPTGAVFQEVPR